MQQNSIVSEPQKKPIITVITICLNMEAEIENTIRSVLQQEDADFEYIIKDGNSSDNTNNIIRKLIKEYGKENVKHIISEDTGIYDAMNQAVSLSNGEWTIFINGGDRFFDKYVLRDFAYKAKNTSEQVIFGNTLYVLKKKRGYLKLHSDLNMNTIFDMGHQSTFVKSSLVKQLKFDDTYIIAGDKDLMQRLKENDAGFKYINLTVSVCDRNGISAGIRKELYYESKRASNLSQRTALSGYLLWALKRRIARMLPMLESYMFCKKSIDRTMRNYDYNYHEKA
nr:glycosyltransferase [uncultured Butyrivibrio sp.]